MGNANIVLDAALTATDTELRKRAIVIASKVGDGQVAPRLVRVAKDPRRVVASLQSLFCVSPSGPSKLHAQLATTQILDDSVLTLALGFFGASRCRDVQKCIKACSRFDPARRRTSHICLVRANREGLP